VQCHLQKLAQPNIAGPRNSIPRSILPLEELLFGLKLWMADAGVAANEGAGLEVIGGPQSFAEQQPLHTDS
jgi:hypothetical protein